MKTLLLLATALTLFSAVIPADRIHEKDIQTLVFTSTGRTTFKRLKESRPQLAQVGGPSIPLPATVQCKNQGLNDKRRPTWRCETRDFKKGYGFGELSVQCEGYDKAGDPFVLVGSCQLKYKVVEKELPQTIDKPYTQEEFNKRYGFTPQYASVPTVSYETIQTETANYNMPSRVPSSISVEEMIKTLQIHKTTEETKERYKPDGLHEPGQKERDEYQKTVKILEETNKQLEERVRRAENQVRNTKSFTSPPISQSTQIDARTAWGFFFQALGFGVVVLIFIGVILSVLFYLVPPRDHYKQIYDPYKEKNASVDTNSTSIFIIDAPIQHTAIAVESNTIVKAPTVEETIPFQPYNYTGSVGGSNTTEKQKDDSDHSCGDDGGDCDGGDCDVGFGDMDDSL